MEQQQGEPDAAKQQAETSNAKQAGAAAAVADAAPEAASSAVAAPPADTAAAAETPAPLPLPYLLDADGRKQPLPGAKSIFIRGGTADAFGLSALSTTAGSSSSAPDAQRMAAVPKEKLLADIQFQGAISDWHPIKEAIKAADYEPLLVRANEDDAYGDGSNYEVAVTQAAAEAWLAADAAAAAAAVAAATAEAAAAAAGGDGADGRQQRRKQRRAPQPWQDFGSEAELEAAGIHTISSTSSTSTTTTSANNSIRVQCVRPSACSSTSSSAQQQQRRQQQRLPQSGLLLSRPRRAFGAPVTLSDAPAADLWASNTMEVWPFKDPTYDLKRATLDRGAQAVPVLQEAAVQATGGRPRHSCCQTVPQTLSEEQAEGLLATPGFAAFLEAVRPRLDEALLQNNLADIMRADLDQLGDEEADGLGVGTTTTASTTTGAAGGGGDGGGAAGAGAGGGGGGGRGSGVAAGGGGHRQERGGLTEAQTFSDLAYSKNKVVSAICWVPNRRGVVAAACTDPASQTQRLATMGRLAPAHILIWNFRDPVHPEYVLESPHEVTTFQYNPVNPDIIIGGCYNGQVIVWDTSSSSVAAAASAGRGKGGKGGGGGGKSGGSSSSHGGGGGAGVWDDGAEAEAVTPVIRHKYLSSVEHSHTTSVCDLCWLPGMEVDRSGKVFAIRANSAGTSAQSIMRSLTLGSAAIAAAAAGSNVPREACFFASIAPDGKVMFWDVRLDKLMKKGNKRVEEADLVWKPMHVVHLLSSAGNDFAGCCFSFDPYRLDSANFTAGSMEGELLAGHFNRPPGDDNPDYSRVVFSPHAGPVVALAVSPFLPELLLSVGDWTFRLWHHALDEGNTVPLFVSPQADETYTAAAWSPSRPGLLFLATSSGTLQVWDLLDRSHEPSLTISASSCAITSLAFSNSPPKHFTHATLDGSGATSTGAHTVVTVGGAGSAGASDPSGHHHSSSSSHHGSHHHQPSSSNPAGQQQQPPQGSGLQVLAVGDAAGVLHLFELPRTLRRPLQNEKRLMEGFVGREAARVADVASRQALRAAALADSKRQDSEASKRGGGPEDSSSLQDQQQQLQQQQFDATAAATGGSATTAATRHSTISGSQAGTLAAAPAPVAAGGTTVKGAASMLVAGAGGLVGAGTTTAAAAARAAELAKAEAAYKALEAEFKEQLGLA